MQKLLSMIVGHLTEVPVSTVIENEEPGGDLNGSNQTYTLANAPNPASSLKVYFGGQRLTYGTDYTVSGATFTYTNVVPNSGDTHVADYRY